jgi:hypothetical protein
MPNPQRPFEDEGVLRTDEQAGPAGQNYSQAEKEFDPAHPPTQMPVKPKDTAKRFRQKDQERTDEQESPSQAVRDAYQDS